MTDDRASRVRKDLRGADLDEARDVLAAEYAGASWRAERTVDDFDFRYSVVGDDHLTLRNVRFHGRLEGEMPRGDDYVVQWITSGTGRLDLGRDEVDLLPNRPRIWPSDRPFRFAFEDYDQKLVQIKRTTVEEVAAERGLDAPTVRFDHTAEPSDGAMQLWRDTVSLISKTVLDREASPLLQAEMGRLGAVSFLELFPQQTDGLPRDLLLPRNAHIRRAVEYVHENAHLPITSTDLAQEANLSLRALQQAFQRQFDVTPNTYIREVRLDRVHAELRERSATTTTIAEVANRWGFLHLGRFSAAYAARFGEYPKETLRH
ncbi:AraC family transcriptional regulator [Curtobacterium sp. MCBD17_040]|uniref:helix-turn-helix transcriptional regulator n=1 Tax=Curtobacterium sp. MCBD17_040 TaxID=2175674 RepID=UPI0015E897E5|nr:AraC family transcriptional regulator [Curtobacterium sp. MCBD17_040]WIB63784.1 AraC family transcriptional regulator [Curtobacterium sp. MCBD17_040]